MPTAIFVTDNPHKAEEYRRQMTQYGADVRIEPWISDTPLLEKQILQWLTELRAQKTTAWVLNEWSDIYNAETHQVSGKTEDMEPVYNKGQLIFYWLDKSGQLCQQHKEHRVYGYLDLAKEAAGGFGWDNIFVNAITGKTYAESIPLWGKCSPRQLLISDFIQQRLFYKDHRSLNFTEHDIDETIAFVPVSAEIAGNPMIGGNKHLAERGLSNFIVHCINDGIHLRFAKNRRENNYWWPGLNGGLPAVAKPDAVHETTYRFHDLTHYGLAPLCDLLPGDDFGPAKKRVYHAARMLSEAFSLVMADMLFVDSLLKSGIEYDYSLRCIYPVFQQVREPENIEALFRASSAFALLGDDSLFRDLLKPGAEADRALTTFTDVYSRFFTADHLWTSQNFDNMSARADLYAEWRVMLGDDIFKHAEVTFLDDFTARIEKRGADMTSFASVTEAVLEEILTTHILPRLKSPPVKISTEMEISNAFRRYMIGQSLFYVQYKDIPGMTERRAAMMARLKGQYLFSASDITDIRKEFEKDVILAHGAQVITHDDRRIFSQVFPLFPPVYLAAYAKQEQDIKGALQNIFGEK